MTPREMVAQAKATGRLEELRPLIAAEPVRPMNPAEAVRFYYTEYREAAEAGHRLVPRHSDFDLLNARSQ